MGKELSLLLRAPCAWCLYDGPGYFQPGTHAEGCPWRNVGGESARMAALIKGEVRERKPVLGPRAEWPEVLMAMAAAAATRSRDATTRVGAIVADAGNRVLGTGYNGPPAGTPRTWTMTGPSRHAYVIHAEENGLAQALMARGARLEGCRLVCTHRPCRACLVRAYHLGVRDVIWGVDELSAEQRDAARSMEASLPGLSCLSLTDLRAR